MQVSTKEYRSLRR